MKTKKLPFLEAILSPCVIDLPKNPYKYKPYKVGRPTNYNKEQRRLYKEWLHNNVKIKYTLKHQ